MKWEKVIDRYEPYVGTKYGRLTFTKITPQKIAGSYAAEFLCECGNVTLQRIHEVQSGKVKSCGCLLQEIHSSHQPKETVYRTLKDSAKKRGYSWSLTYDETWDLLNSDCFYCGQSPTPDSYGIVRNGIDRYVNSVGYEALNCVTACSTCNRMKGTLDGDDFLGQIHKITQHSPQNG